MKKLSTLGLLTIIGILFHQNTHAVESVVTFFIKNKELQHNENFDQELTSIVSEKISQPSYVIGYKKDVASNQDGIRGIQAAYLGYMATSNKNGQLSFPRKQQSDTILLFITPQIKPIFMIHPTLIHHWQVDPSQPIEIYEINRNKDKKLNSYYFDIIDIKQALKNQKLDEKKSEMYQNIISGTLAIPFNTVTIFADPKNISVPIGTPQNYYSTNFILPTLSGEKVDMTENSLYTLSIKQYFEQVNIATKNDGTHRATIVTNQ